VDAYLAAQPDGARQVLARVRDTIRKALRGAEETMSYRIPTYKRDGRAVLYFAGWKEHFSIYPATDRVIESFARELQPYEVHKGTIRFPFGRPVPLALIARIAKLRAKESAERAKSKGKATSRRRAK
jgi:uncharacterized protein YdhG (YjbR/CyaY superfamily)